MEAAWQFDVGLEPAAEAADSRDTSASVIPFPSPDERGFFDGKLSRHSLLAADPISLVTGVWRTLNHLKDLALDKGDSLKHSNPTPERLFIPLDGHDHLLLFTKPDPETGIRAQDAKIAWFKPGIVELADTGSPLRLHMTYAREHPDQCTVTEETKGMSLTGKPVPLSSLSERQIESMADESLQLMRIVTNGAESDIDATSLGSRLAIAMAEQNLAANPADQVSITRLRLIASAAIACKIEGSENFRPADVDEDDYRENLSKSFQRHIPEDFLRMARLHPTEMLACWPTLAAHLLAHPATVYNRMMTMATDYANVKEGTPWSSLKYVAAGMPIDVLGGERDPLIQEQIPQWNTLNRLHPGKIKLRVIEGMGHLMTVNARGTISELDKMDQEETHEPVMAV